MVIKKLLIIIAGFTIGFLFSAVWIKFRYGHRLEVKTWHIHHSCFSFITLFLASFTPNVYQIFFLGISGGIILEHTLNEGFKFIEKSN